MSETQERVCVGGRIIGVCFGIWAKHGVSGLCRANVHVMVIAGGWSGLNDAINASLTVHGNFGPQTSAIRGGLGGLIGGGDWEEGRGISAPLVRKIRMSTGKIPRIGSPKTQFPAI